MTAARTENMRCIVRIDILVPKKTHGWQVRVTRRGIHINEFFSDAKFGGRAGSLSEAMHFRDATVKTLRPYSRAELACRNAVRYTSGIPGARNTSGIPGVRRRVKPAKRGDKVHEYIVWSASGSPSPNRRKTRDFYVGKLGEDEAREMAIAQRLRWEQQMERREHRLSQKPRAV